MTETYTNEKLYDAQNTDNFYGKTSEPEHVYKLIGALYREREESPGPAPVDEQKLYETRVLSEAETSAKKVRSVSARAVHTDRAIQETVNECK